MDFVSFSYYNTNCINVDEQVAVTSGNLFASVKNPYLKYTDWGWSIDPLGLRITLNEVYDRYRKPLFIVENGIGAIDTINENGEIIDDYRINFHRDHIKAMKDAIEIDSVDLDNEGKGSLKRTKKKSFDWYKKVIASNGVLVWV